MTQIEHEYGVRVVAFSPDNKWLATMSHSTARVWEIITKRKVAEITYEDWIWRVTFTPLGQVYAVAFNSIGEWVAAGSRDGAAQGWLLWPDSLITGACARLTRNLTPDEWRQYLGAEPYCKTCPNLP